MPIDSIVASEPARRRTQHLIRQWLCFPSVPLAGFESRGKTGSPAWCRRPPTPHPGTNLSQPGVCSLRGVQFVFSDPLQCGCFFSSQETRRLGKSHTCSLLVLFFYPFFFFFIFDISKKITPVDAGNLSHVNSHFSFLIIIF